MTITGTWSVIMVWARHTDKQTLFKFFILTYFGDISGNVFLTFSKYKNLRVSAFR